MARTGLTLNVGMALIPRRWATSRASSTSTLAKQHVSGVNSSDSFAYTGAAALHGGHQRAYASMTTRRLAGLSSSSHSLQLCTLVRRPPKSGQGCELCHFLYRKNRMATTRKGFACAKPTMLSTIDMLDVKTVRESRA